MKKFFVDITTPFKNISKENSLILIISWSVILLGLWQTSSSPLIPKPLDVIVQLKTYLSSISFYYDIYNSLELIFISMVISIGIACFSAYASTMSIFKFPIQILIMMRFMSLLGFLFIFMSIFNGEAYKVKNALLVFSIVPYFTLSLVSVISKIPQKEFDLWTSLKFNKWEQLYQIVIRGRADAIIEAVFSNFSMAWVMMTLAETKSMADGGLGVELFKADKYNNIDKVLALQIIIFVLGFLLMQIIKRARYKAFPHTAFAENQ